MPIFTPFSETTPIPPEGKEYEREILDLKLTVELATQFHRAKDIAAFANHIGGTVLIGVKEEAGRVLKHVGMNERELNETQNAVSEAIKRCQPKPFVQPVRRLLREGLHLLAMNVWPTLSGAVVGVRVEAIKDVEGYGDAAWVFPVRVVTGTDFLPPEQLPMFMSPKVRRAVVMLTKIQKHTVVRLAVGLRGSMAQGFVYRANMGEVDEANNAVSFENCQADHSTSSARIVVPLDHVRTVVHRPEGWLVSVKRFE